MHMLENFRIKGHFEAGNAIRMTFIFYFTFVLFFIIL